MHGQSPKKSVFWIEIWASLSCSFDPSLSYEEREKRIRQAAGRVGFVQDLLLSTLFSD